MTVAFGESPIIIERKATKRGWGRRSTRRSFKGPEETNERVGDSSWNEHKRPMLANKKHQPQGAYFGSKEKNGNSRPGNSVQSEPSSQGINGFRQPAFRREARVKEKIEFLYGIGELKSRTREEKGSKKKKKRGKLGDPFAGTRFWGSS